MTACVSLLGTTPPASINRELTSTIVAAYVRRNQIGSDQLAALISTVLLYGARRFVRRLNELGIAHCYEAFPDNHTGVDYRMDESLPFLARALTG
jgi:hypothetical protein